MMQGTSGNQEKHFESGTAAEQGGIDSESSKKPFVTKNIIIAIVGVIVAALVGVMIFVHVTGRSIGGGSKNGQFLISKNGQSLISKKEPGLDRIFFFVRPSDENRGGMEEIQSILEDKTEFRTHGKFRTNHVSRKFSSNNEAQIFLYTNFIDENNRIVLQDWNTDSKKMFDSIGTTPSFSADGNQIVFIDDCNDDSIQLSIANKNGDVLKKVNLEKDFGKVKTPLFSHDGNSLIFLSENDNCPTEVIKINIDDDQKVEKICNMDCGNVDILVSPVHDKIFCHYNYLFITKAKFSLVDFNDMSDIKSHEIEIEIDKNEFIDLISWSSDGKCIYMHKKSFKGPESIVKLDLESKEIIEIYEIPEINCWIKK